MKKDIEDGHEIWKDVAGYEGHYQVSNLGRVHSLDRFVPRKTGTVQKVRGRILEPQKDKDGYLQVGLWKENKAKKAKVHRIVAKAFVPNLNGLPEINHINEVKDDNRVNNLEWCTRKENINHGTRSEQVSKTTGKPVVGTCLKTGEETFFRSMRETSRFGFHPSAVRKVCIGEQEAHKGYSWKFAKEGEKSMSGYERLDSKWINEHVDYADVKGGTQAFIHVDDLQNLLVPKQELPVIPKFVADYIDDRKEVGFPIYQAIRIVRENSRFEHSHLREWLWTNKGQETFARAWLDGYEVAEEQKYIISINITDKDSKTNYETFLNKRGIFHSMENDSFNSEEFNWSEEEIKDLENGEILFEHFAVKIEELEE